MNPPPTEFDAQFTCSERLQKKINNNYIYIVYILYINTFSDELFIMVENINFFYNSLSDRDKYIQVEELYSNNKNINLANSSVLMIGYSV